MDSARSARHRSRSLLAAARSGSHLEEWGDALLDAIEPQHGRSMHTRRHTPAVEHPKGQTEHSARNRPKVWKMPFWKRRSSERARKAG
jgi:hypothetical protein